MYRFFLVVLCVLWSAAVVAQTVNQPNSNAANTENIYAIKKQFLEKILHNGVEKEETENDNDLERFNRWFNDAEVRCYPSGDLPRPDVLIKATEGAGRIRKQANKTTIGAAPWKPVGPVKVPSDNNGIGRINCIVISPLDTNTLYVGAACGGVWISHDGGTNWVSNSDNFPSLSIADIAVNPIHTDTLYAATGDGYGYEQGGFNIFWGGLYSAGVMKSTDGGSTWATTGLSYLQSDRNIIQKLLIHPRKTNILLAATRDGIWRTTDAAATWVKVDAGHVYSLAFRPGRPDTVYAVNNADLRVSYNAGATWQVLTAGINPSGDRASIAVSAAAPGAVWVLDAAEELHVSHNGGVTFATTNSPADTANFYGYYDRVLAASPADSNYILAFGMIMAKSADAGTGWYKLDPPTDVHVDNHAVAINPLHSATIYTGNDGGISVTRDGGNSWKNLGDGLMISQIYRMGISLQDTNLTVCGLQDNGTFWTANGTDWFHRVGGDGMDCAVHPADDYLEVASYQNGNFFISVDQGVTFSYLHVSNQVASWTAPVAFDPVNELRIYFGYDDIFATYDQGTTFNNLTHTKPFSGGATCLAVAPSNPSVIYAADFGHIITTTDAGVTWTNATGNFPANVVAITHLAIDFVDPNHVYMTTSGYVPGDKVYETTDGGLHWTNITATGLPNIPANCIAIDSSTPGALFAGTDMGVYYTDAAHPGWSLYSSGLPNVIVNDLKINYVNYKVKAATYGRGVWQTKLQKDPPPPVNKVNAATVGSGVSVFPNPAVVPWKIVFGWGKPSMFRIKVTDASGKMVVAQTNNDVVNASGLAAGVYNIEVVVGHSRYTAKAIKE